MLHEDTSGQRQTTHLLDYDYSQEGYYFITICTAQRQHFFGAIRDGQMHRNTAGE